MSFKLGKNHAADLCLWKNYTDFHVCCDLLETCIHVSCILPATFTKPTNHKCYLRSTNMNNGHNISPTPTTHNC